MPTIAEIRQKSGDAYNDLSDQQLGDAIYKKYYSDMPRAEFDAKIGAGGEREPAAGNVPAGQSRSNDYDVPASFGVGALKGGIGMAGLSGDLRELAASGAGLVGVDPQTASKYLRYIPLMGGPTSGQIRSAVEGVTGDLYEPRTTAGEYAQTTGEFLPGAIGGGGGIAAKAARVAIPAAGSEALGQLTAGTAAEPYMRAAGALAGGMGVSKLENAVQRAGQRALPSLERGVQNSLPDAAQAEYGAITRAGAAVRTTPHQRALIADNIENHLHPQNFRRANAPETYEILDDIRTGSRTPDVADLMTARRRLGNVRGEDGVAAGQARDILDQVLDAYIPGVGRQLATADQNWNAYRTAQMLGERFNRAELQAAGTNSGLNLGNRLRQQATQIATNPRLNRYMRAEDRAALEALDRGTPLQNTTRWVGNYLGGGGGLGALGASALLGHLAGGPIGSAAAVLGGLGLKRGYNRSIAREADRIANTIVARSPEAQRLGVNYIPPMTIGQSAPGGFRGGLLGFLGQQ